MTTEETGFDPVALTLALWLGLLTCIGGVMRLSENAAAADAATRPPSTPIVFTDPAGFGAPFVLAAGQAAATP